MEVLSAPAPVLTPAVTLSTLPYREPLPSAEIATFEPLAVVAKPRYPISERTGEPVRPGMLLAAIISCWVSVAVTVGAFIIWWWQAAHIDTFHDSARLLTWIEPDPVSAGAIALVMTIGLIALIQVAAAGLVGFNAWAGHRWVRVAGIICLSVLGLSFLVSWWFSAAMIPLAVGVVLLWLSGPRRFFDAMDASRAISPVAVPVFGIKYGPQPLIGRRD